MAAELTDTLRNAGALLSNCAFNLGQRTPGTILTAEDVSVLKSLARQWDAALATQQVAQGAEPLFFYRPCRDGLYEGPHHANSVGGKMLRDEKPGEWKPLYTAPPLTAEVEKDLREALRDLAEAGEEAWGPDRPCVREALRVLAALQSEAALDQKMKARGG